MMYALYISFMDWFLSLLFTHIPEDITKNVISEYPELLEHQPTDFFEKKEKIVRDILTNKLLHFVPSNITFDFVQIDELIREGHTDAVACLPNNLKNDAKYGKELSAHGIVTQICYDDPFHMLQHLQNHGSMNDCFPRLKNDMWTIGMKMSSERETVFYPFALSENKKLIRGSFDYQSLPIWYASLIIIIQRRKDKKISSLKMSDKYVDCFILCREQ